MTNDDPQPPKSPWRPPIKSLVCAIIFFILDKLSDKEPFASAFKSLLSHVPPEPDITSLVTLAKTIDDYQSPLACLGVLGTLALYQYSHPRFGPQALYTICYGTFVVHIWTIGLGMPTWYQVVGAYFVPDPLGKPLWVLPLCSLGQNFGEELMKDGGPLRGRLGWGGGWREKTGRCIHTAMFVWVSQWVWFKTGWEKGWRISGVAAGWVVTAMLVMMPGSKCSEGLRLVEEDWEMMGWIERGKRGVFRWMTAPQRRYWERRDGEIEKVAGVDGEGEREMKHRWMKMGTITAFMWVFGLSILAMQALAVWGRAMEKREKGEVDDGNWVRLALLSGLWYYLSFDMWQITGQSKN